MNTLISLILTLLSIPTSSAMPNQLSLTQHGIAKYYSPGVFERVAQYRIRHGIYPSTSVVGYASVPDCRRLGQTLWASINGHRWEPYQVMDCSAPRDRASHIAQGLVIEVDCNSARRNGFTRQGRAPAIVYYPPPRP